jgi:LuxR family transcriptional regulator, maltose regulon positive regulatory protein
MGTTATVRQPRPLQRRRIIERQRLLALLDESKARVRTLVAPAGYGKTTLAEQWVDRAGRQGVWYTARRSSQDVAALALGLARASSTLVAGCDARLREHLRAVPTPAENVEILAEILGEDLDAWPAHGWLVIDEYQEFVGAREAERFVCALVSASPIQLLIATRQRPSWVTTRGLLYGEVLELNQTALAMDSTEAAEVLGGNVRQSASGLVALANGWPAVIGLASVSSAELKGDRDDPVPESLYRFFAEEVFDALGGDVQEGLAVLSLAPVLDRDLAGVLLGSDAESICQAALDVGILVERGSSLELHPLARSFLDERSSELGSGCGHAAIVRCLDHYRERRDWDAAFDVIARHGAAMELGALLLAGLDELLDTARLSTIETWCALGSEFDLETSSFALARAEVALRHGRHGVAQAFAEAAASVEGSGLRFRSLSVAGRAAHLASREEDALELYHRAEAAATTEPERRDALWGQVMCSIELERPEATATLRALSAGMGLSRPRDVVRAAAYTISSQLKLGSLDLAEADVALELLTSVDDPLVESAFQNVYSAALALSARYDEALEIATDLLDTVRRYRLEFALPYALSVMSVAHAGRREWSIASRHLDDALAAARVGRNAYAEHICFAIRLRSLAQEGRLEEGLAIPVPQLRFSLPAARAEVLGSRALVLASAGKLDEAESLVEKVRGSSSAIEPAVLVAAVDAISGLKRRSPAAIDRVTDLVTIAFSTGAIDLLVTAYRSAPELLAVLLRHPDRERVVRVLWDVHDEDLAQVLGQPIGAIDDPRARLTPRERDVFELLRHGFSNRQIAKLLFIEESTVKVHAHHIYDKLGTRSRTALAVQAALERADQATSATGTTDSAEAP